MAGLSGGPGGDGVARRQAPPDGGAAGPPAPPGHDLTTGALPAHFRRLAVPGAVGMVFSTLTNVTDTFFAGMISTSAQAGLALSAQVFMLLVALGFGMNGAMAALVGNALGARSGAQARIAGQGLILAALIALALLVAGRLLAPALVGLIAAPGPARIAAQDYLTILLWAAPAFLVGWGANGILSAQGDTRSMSRAQIGIFLANAGLDPLLVFGIPGLLPGMGFDGIAVSTVLCNLGMLGWILWRVMRSPVMAGAARRWRPDPRLWLTILAQAVPASLAMVIMMIAGFVLQYHLAGYGAEAQAAYGVALRIEQVLLLPAFGLTGALLPIAAQNLGAGRAERVREAARFCVVTGWVLMLGAAAILWLGGRAAMGLFTDDARVIALGAGYLAVDGFLLPVYVTLFAINALLQAFRRPVWVMVIGLWRQGVAVALFVRLFSVGLGLGVPGVWYGLAAAVLSGLVLAVAIVEWQARPLVGGLLWRAGPRPGAGGAGARG
ncbi:MAG: MATE family efflux transporter [Paracoccaceae bacterium]|nr:MAG: MATE family efflux transporter [Paracoccaceae bacterium]